MPNWQAKAARTRQPYQPKLVVLPATPCAVCSHPRSSHSMLVLTGHCHATGCECDMFEPVCGCGHLYSWHVWSAPPDPWGCARCPCARFGAAQEASAVYQAALFDMTR